MEKEPMHIAVIMDGNRRWAKKHSLEPWKGHEKGKEILHNLINYFGKKDQGINYLTLYSLSLENLKNRSEIEKKFLFSVFKQGFSELLKEPIIFDKKVNVDVIGRWDLIPDKELKELIQKVIDATKDHKEKFVRLAIGYDGQDEIVHACQKIVDSGAKKVTPEIIKQNLFTKDLPPVDLMIRTGGEKRLSGFLLWDASYAELYFTETLFPDITSEDFETAIEDYKSRQRRFGK